ncbi:MAG: hypothetical protein FJ190_10545 [Gammaproteobacteria bacterium]|nr:hypothetical protein [Gammaproteobacteria bacterium]
MNDIVSSTEQNFVIKVICVIGLINASQMVTLIFSPMTKHLGAVYPAYFVLSVILSLICIILKRSVCLLCRCGKAIWWM